MKSKYYLLIIVIILITIITGSYLYFQTTKSSPGNTNKQETQNQRITEVTLDINAPLSNATIVVTNLGEVLYQASSPDTGIEEYTDSIKISQEQFNNLANFINQNNFWSFNERYYDETLMDGTSYNITVRSIPSSYPPELAYPRNYTVSCYGSCPQVITEIINMIKELWGKEILEVGI